MEMVKKSLRIAIVDDNDEDREWVKRVAEAAVRELGNNLADELSMETYISANDLLTDLECGAFYSVFLIDIKMPETTGLILAKEIQKYYTNVVIIFITDYIEYAVNAFEVNAYRYILKRELDVKLPQALQDVIPRLRKRSNGCYLLSHYRDLEVILYDDIYYISKENKNVVFHHRYGVSYERKTLKQVYEKLPKIQFIEAGRGYIVNVAQIKRFGSREILLYNGKSIPVGKANTNEMMVKVMEYWSSEKLQYGFWK